MVVSKAMWKKMSLAKPKAQQNKILPPTPNGKALMTAAGIVQHSYKADKHRKINAKEII